VFTLLVSTQAARPGCRAEVPAATGEIMSDDDLGHTPISAVIRARVKEAGHRFHANDNLSEFIRGEAELKRLEEEVCGKAQALLESLIIDTEGDHNTRGTAERIARMFLHEVFRGRYRPIPRVAEFPNAEHLNELMIVGPITVRSACSHHLVPILGKLWVGVLPNEQSNLIGLSKYSRIADWVMSRPQIQEEAVMQLADELERRLKPDGLALVLEADHFCMQWRGVKDESHMTNSIMRGQFLINSELRREFLQLVKP
jgi:GTP cyclohydrolase I